jgi:hypothetical protein
MLTSGAARALPFDPERDGVPSGLESVVTRQEPAALLLVRGPDDDWSERAAIALADLIARQRRVILADLHFENPRLHERLGSENAEGVADVVLFGASPDHVASRVDGHGFEFLPPGAFVPDPAEVLASGEWPGLVRRIGASGGTLIAYAPVHAAAALARAFDAAVALGDADISAVGDAEDILVLTPGAPAGDEPPIEESAPPATPVAAIAEDATDAPVLPATDAAPVTAPAAPPVPLPAPRSPEAAREAYERVRLPRDAERDALIADLRARQRAALAQPLGAVGETAERQVVHPRPIVGGPAESEAAPLTEPPVTVAREPARRGRRRRPVVLAVVAIVLIGVIAAALYFGQEYLSGRQLAEQPPAEPVTPPVESLTGDPAGAPLPYSVAVEAHEDLTTAVRRVESLTRADPATGFYIAPILVDSSLYYRVMAGPVQDSTTAASVMQNLIRRGLKSAGTEYDIRATPYAFLLGEYELREQAQQRMLQLRPLGIPSYIIEVPYTKGPPRYYLYSGAYAGAAEADVMRQMLRSAGLPDTLVERTGRSPA